MNHKTYHLYAIWLLVFFFISCDTDMDEITASLDPGFYSASIIANIDGIGLFNGHDAQGFAVYHNVGFCFYDSGFCQTIDLERRSIIASFALPPGVANPNNHCGVACFSSQFLEQEDIFPLLYLSSYKELKCYVLRMTETSADLVQTIQMKDDQDNVIPTYAFMPDEDLLLLKSNYPTKQDGSFTYIWRIVNRPDITDSITTFIMPKDVSFTFSVKSSDAYNAGFCRKGKIYQIAGYHGFGSKKLYIIDYNSGIVLKEVVFSEPFLYQKEHEQCSPYGDDGMLINYNGADYISYIKFNYWRYE